MDNKVALLRSVVPQMGDQRYFTGFSLSWKRKNPRVFQSNFRIFQVLSFTVHSQNIYNTRHSSLTFTIHSFVTQIKLYAIQPLQRQTARKSTYIYQKFPGLTQNSWSFPGDWEPCTSQMPQRRFFCCVPFSSICPWNMLSKMLWTRGVTVANDSVFFCFFTFSPPRTCRLAAARLSTPHRPMLINKYNNNDVA